MRKAAFKSGCELVFPILFRHMTFATHGCWQVFMGKAIYFANEAWRIKYGQMPTQDVPRSNSQLLFQLSASTDHLLEGWRQEQRDGNIAFVRSDGRQVDPASYVSLVSRRMSSKSANVPQTSLDAIALLRKAQATDTERGQKSSDATCKSKAVKEFLKESKNFALAEGSTLEPKPDNEHTAETGKRGKATYHQTSQLDDYLHRGDDPLLRPMNLYVYSMWVFRVEIQPASGQASGGRFVDIPFEASYPGSSTWIQRLAPEPRVPMPKDFYYGTESADAEKHFQMKSILLRPIYLAPKLSEDTSSRQLRIIEAYTALCTPTNPAETWPALRGGPDSPGPFERGFKQHFRETVRRADAADRISLGSVSQDCPPRWQSVWETQELQHRLQALAADSDDAEDMPEDDDDGRPARRRLSVEEYCAMITVRVSSFYTGIAKARSEKPKREIDEDKSIQEAPSYVEGAEDDVTADADAQVEGAEQRARLGLGSFGQQMTLMYRHHDDMMLDKIIKWDTQERHTAFTKRLLSIPFMADCNMPGRLIAERALSQEVLKSSIWNPYSTMRVVLDLKDRVQQQRSLFNDAASEDEDSEPEVPPLLDASHAARPSEELPAYFAPGGPWRRPSDFLKHQACRFEDGLTDPPPPPGTDLKKKKLTEDQIIFLARFAEICDCVWDDEDNNVPMEERRRYNILLLGQGGTGKTAIVQAILLPVIDFLFPPDASATPPASSLIVCASWAQAENISNNEHKAMTIHKACSMRVQSLRNADMAPGDRLPGLKKTWANKKFLICEEVSMVSPSLLNMLLYRSFHARRDKWDVDEADYDKPSGAFGRMPIALCLGDFCQLRPTASASLIDNPDDSMSDIPPEWQMATKLFMDTTEIFELRATKRFQDPKLEKLINFMRNPTGKIPADVARSWESIKYKDNDPRLHEARFQDGHMLGIYWETIARWGFMRAERDAKALRTPHLASSSCRRLLATHAGGARCQIDEAL